jgi:hypothetical protein
MNHLIGANPMNPRGAAAVSTHNEEGKVLVSELFGARSVLASSKDRNKSEAFKKRRHIRTRGSENPTTMRHDLTAFDLNDEIK